MSNMYLDHVTYPIPGDKFEEEIKFFTAALGHTGFKEIMRPRPPVVGMGIGKAFFWLVRCSEDRPEIKDEESQSNFRYHVAFTADTHEEVEQFYNAAIKAGGKDNGKPGLRPHYHPGYFGAFVISPSGLNVEVVNHHPK